jgi:hypothetical protein
VSGRRTALEVSLVAKKTLFFGAGIVSLAVALTVPLIAQERGGMGGSEKEGTSEKIKHEEVTIDRPFAEVSGRVPGAIERAGLILLADVDWTRYKGRGGMPGTKLAGATNVRSYFLCDEMHVNKVLEEPAKGLWSPAIVVCEKSGKTEVLYFRPTVKLEEMKKHGIIGPEKYEEHFEHARQLERKLDQVIETLRGSKSS